MSSDNLFIPSVHARVHAWDRDDQDGYLQDQRHAARLTVARHAHDRDDCVVLLDMLGLLPDTNPRH
ncbi:hypothetical protein GCM10022243_48950 [Saccharothrix violaceirubra]|uniref:Uncharacterized protein n=1 Tax=Saccharothrix violaceirubra TaxID=413306 RepID=A0A7W7SZD4_9PSEU|nr:hypothetical protein [Saccharothrix violaceirubra]MBB4963763.1 hypothetical protein [Saccharothrix violaceirubra]